MHVFRLCSKLTNVSLPQTSLLISSRLTSCPACETSSSKSLAGWGASLVECPALSSSPVLVSSSNGPKRNPELPTDALQCTPPGANVISRKGCSLTEQAHKNPFRLGADQG